MNPVFRNPALLQWQAHTPAAAHTGLREVVFQTGMRWSFSEGDPPVVWFLESGLMALEQGTVAGPVEVALIGCDAAVPLLEPGKLHLRALSDGHAVCLPAAQALSLGPALLLGWQQALLGRIARLATCARAHRPEQALADALLWAHLAAADAALAWTIDALPGGQRLPPDRLEALLQQWVAAGALRREGQRLQVHDASVLASMACGCHAAGPQPGAPSPAP